MGRLTVWLLVMPVIVASGAGCTPLGHCCRQCESLPEQPNLPLPPMQRTNMDILLQLGSASLALHPPAERPQNYRALTAEQCRCRAAQVQDTANMLDAQADDIARQLERPCVPPGKAKELKLKEDVLRANAMEMRNTNAGLGLTLFYRIMETEALIDLQEESLRVLAEGLARVRELKERGLKATEDYEALRRRELDMQTDLARLKQATDDLNTELVRLLELTDVTCNCPTWFWPVFKLHSDAALPECNAAVAEGMKQRPELWMLARIAEDLDVHTLKVVEQMLSAANGLFGMGDANALVKCLADLMAALCDSGPVAREVELRRQQVNEHRESRMVVISGEIRQDVSTLEHGLSSSRCCGSGSKASMPTSRTCRASRPREWSHSFRSWRRDCCG